MTIFIFEFSSVHYQNEINIIVSGHTSTGGTVTALILAYLLEKKFVYAGGTHKFIGEKLGYHSKGKSFIDYEKKYGEKWDIIWENYIAWKLKNEKNLLVNSKIAGFFADGEENLFKVFITASDDIRAERAGGDGRSEDIHKRDEELANRWKRLFDFDFLNKDDIRENHDLFVDNSQITISQTVFEIYKAMRGAMGVREEFTLSQITKLEDLMNEKGKQFFYDHLESKNLLITPSEVFRDWINNFSDELKETRAEWRNVVLENAKEG